MPAKQIDVNSEVYFIYIIVDKCILKELTFVYECTQNTTFNN